MKLIYTFTYRDPSYDKTIKSSQFRIDVYEYDIDLKEAWANSVIDAYPPNKAPGNMINLDYDNGWNYLNTERSNSSFCLELK